MDFKKAPWSELIGDDIVELFSANSGAERIEWVSLAIVMKYLMKKYAISGKPFTVGKQPVAHCLLLRVSIERREIFQLLESKMPGKFRMFSDDDITQGMMQHPRIH